LEDEFLLLKQLAPIAGVPAPRSYRRTGDWELLEMTLLAPLQGHDPTFGPPKESLRDFWAVVQRTREINRRGCSHGDLHARNSGRNTEGTVSFFDFDQALASSPLRCTLRDFFGFSAMGVRAKVSLLDRACDVKTIGVVPRAWKLLKRMPVKVIPALRRGPSNLSAQAALRNDVALKTLAEAWEIAADSAASSPGIHVAYYSLDVSGMNFPGERPWILRWNAIRTNMDFRGKRLLELGCNLGLLSIHAKLSGASGCVAMDLDSDVLKAARLAAAAFGADIEFIQGDLNAIDEHSTDPAHFDIVSALSVMHWVRNKEKMWAFLSRFPQILYEGHEPETEAEELLKRAGFTNVISLGQTERSRTMFLASRHDAGLQR
jgi:SAM-dependent methyltransferase